MELIVEKVRSNLIVIVKICYRFEITIATLLILLLINI